MAPAAEEVAESPEAALVELDRSEQALLGSLPGTGTRGEVMSDTPTAKKPATPMAAGGASPSPVSVSNPCEGACRAYGSMQRAASRLCELAGKEDDRCMAAQGRVDRATERLKASCPMCDGIRN